MLGGKYTLHDIDDVEAWCGRVLDRQNLNLSFHDREDLHTYLIEAVWELNLVFRGGRFSGFAATHINRKISDWKRSRYRTKWTFGPAASNATNGESRTIERPRPVFVSVDDPVGDAYPYQPVDVTPDRSTDLMRVLRNGDSNGVGYDVEDGEAEDECAA